MSSTHVEPLKAFSRHFLSREHGGDRDPVPKSWQHAKVLQPTTWYGLSSLYYSAAGMLLACLLALYPERGLTGDGCRCARLARIISFKCDALICAYHRGRTLPTGSLPPLSSRACLSDFYCLVRRAHGIFAARRGCLRLAHWILRLPSLVRACHEVDLLGYARGMRWHLAFPCGLTLFWLLNSPCHSITCIVT